MKSVIQRLSDITINRIAAGEVVERPSSVVKELVENSLDAGATEITIKIEAGGRNLISIIDNGSGMSSEDLFIAVDKHTTSKLHNNDLLDIKYFGFRGEALPSIAAVSRMTIKSLARGAQDAWKIEIHGGDKKEVEPTKCSYGTIIEINDLFFATPARLKFLRSEATEVKHIQDMLKSIAFAHPAIDFSLFVDNKLSLEFKASKDGDIKNRAEAILGKSFKENSVPVDINSAGIAIKGFISLPTYDRGTSTEQYLYINKRPVKDKMLLSAIRVAYKDFISRERYPVVVLFMDIPFSMVDVNVHPAKTEVRFRDFNMVRSLLINGLRNALNSGGQKASSTIAEATLGAMKIEPRADNVSQNLFKQDMYNKGVQIQNSFSIPRNHSNNIQQNIGQVGRVIKEQWNNFNDPVARGFEEDLININEYQETLLGAARCQVHECYIVSQTEDSVVIVDQHAAHERLTYEKLKKALKGELIDSQRLLIPEMIESDEDTVAKVLAIKANLEEYGLVIEPCTKKSILITSVPFVLGDCNIKKVIHDLLDDIIEFEDNITFRETIQEKLATYACHHSIRSGRKMNLEEMNALLREMEQVEHSGQCNHGRPTYIKLSLKDIEKLFGRS